MSIANLSGSFTTTPLKTVHYGAGTIKTLPDLIRQLLAPAVMTKKDEGAEVKAKAMIITGKSLRNKTPVISEIENLLKKENMYGVTFSDIAQHARE